MKKLPILGKQSRTKEIKPFKIERDKEEVSFYKTYKWTKTSKNYRKRNPLCVECLEKGRTRKADVVDHIVPIKHGGELLNEENFQSLCHSHHNMKTAKDKKKYL